MSQLFFNISQTFKKEDRQMNLDIKVDDIEISTNEDESQEVSTQIKGKKIRGI